MHQPTVIDLETKLISNYCKRNIVNEIIYVELRKNESKTISKLNQKGEKIPDPPQNLFVRSNREKKL